MVSGERARHSRGYFHVGRGLGCHYYAATDRLDYANAELAVGLHYPGFARIDLGSSLAPLVSLTRIAPHAGRGGAHPHFGATL